MNQILFVLKIQEESTTLTLTADGWITTQFSFYPRRYWMPLLPEFLQSNGFLEPGFSLTARTYYPPYKLQSILGVPCLDLLQNASGQKAVALTNTRLCAIQCDALFAAMPQLCGIAHAEKVTAAPPAPAVRPPPPLRQSSSPEFQVRRPYKPMLQTIDTQEDDPWL